MRKLIFVLFVLCLLSSTAAVPKKTAPTPKPVDIDLVVDSAMILADDYVEAVANRPEMAKTRLNAIKRFYAPYASNKPVADSICNSIYNIYVDNIERDKVDRANAFKECFLTLADKDNENLGPLYATELALAKENQDTTTINRILPLLTDYASRLNYDYDEEIGSAEDFMLDIRTRKPIEEELIGIWVSDDMLRNPISATKHGISFGKVMNVMGTNSYANRLRDAEAENAIVYLNMIGIEKGFDGKIRVTAFGDKGWGLMFPQKNELSRYNLVVDESKVNKKSKNRSPNWMYDPVESLADNQSRWLYSLWGTEELKRNNPELTAALRQSIQDTHATVVGHYSRSKYNFGDQLAANAIASGFSVITNTIIDHFSVSKDKIYSAEINLQHQKPDKLVGRIDITYTEVRSDNPIPKTKERGEEVTFYRWEPSDNVFFLSVMETFVPLFEPSKDEMKKDE